MEASILTPGIDLVLILLFVVLLIIFAYFGFSFVHHWNLYSFNSQFKKIAQSLYFFFSILILLTMLFFIGVYI